MEIINIICVDDQREVLSAVLQDLSPLADYFNIEDCESAIEARIESYIEKNLVYITGHFHKAFTGMRAFKANHALKIFNPKAHDLLLINHSHA